MVAVIGKKDTSRRLQGGSVIADTSKMTLPCTLGAILTVCTAISSPGPSEQQAVPPSISVLGYSLPALTAAAQDAAEPPAPRSGISYTPSISSRHQFHDESSNKRSIVLKAKNTIFSLFVTLT